LNSENTEGILQKLENFLSKEFKNGNRIRTFSRKKNIPHHFRNLNIGLAFGENRDIILKEETGLELGGRNQTSFKYVYPLQISQGLRNSFKLLRENDIILLGPEISELKSNKIDFGIFVMVDLRKTEFEQNQEIFSFNMLSNSIEGFHIRSIPKRFWCRISSKLLNKGFSFELLANAIIYLYENKLNKTMTLESVRIIMISSLPDLITKFDELISVIKQEQKLKWNQKVEEWEKKVDCEYEWSCEICPYKDKCKKVKALLETREDYINKS
jgi:CO dehydrogenase/acetyl-CoA synthase beta subunit